MIVRPIVRPVVRSMVNPVNERLGASWSSYWTQRFISDLLAVPVSNSRIDLSWVNNGSVDWSGTKIYSSIDSGATFTLLDTIATVGTSYSVTGLTAGQFYVFYAVPYRGSNDGAISNRAYNYPLVSETTTYITGLTTTLSNFQKSNINHFFGDVKAWLGIANISDKADISYVLAGTTEESSLRNIASADFTATKQGSPSFTAKEGFRIPNTSNYVKTNWKDATNGVKFTKDNASEIFFLFDAISNDIHIPSGAVKTVGGNKFTQILPKYLLTASVAINSSVNINKYNYSFDRGMYAAFRDTSTAVRLYINAIKFIDVNNNTSADLNDVVDFIGCRNLDGSPNAPAVNKAISFKWKGETLLEAQYLLLLKAFDAYMRRSGNSVLSYMETQNNQNGIASTMVFDQGVDFTANNCFFRIPFIINVNENIVICGTEARRGGTGDFVMSDVVYKRSSDGGATWGVGQVLIANNNVFTTPSHGSRVVNPCAVRKGSRIFVFGSPIDDATTTTYYGVALGAPTFYSYFGYKYSDDGGLTWSAWQDLSALKTAETNLLAAGPSSNGLVLTNGTIVIPMLDHRHSNNTADAGADWAIRSGLLYSTDNGATWHLSPWIPQFTDEGTIIEYKTNEIMLISRGLDIYYRAWVTADMGDTWTQHVATDKLLQGGPTQVCAMKYSHSGVTKFLLTKDWTQGRADIRLRICDNPEVIGDWVNVCQLWAPACAGYTSMSTDENGSLFITLETGIDVVMWNFTQFKNDLIKGPAALPYDGS